jgi:hypothetical protein
MFRVLQLLYSPGEAWLKIVAAKRGVIGTFLLGLLPVLALSFGGEGYALLHGSKAAGQLGRSVALTTDQVMWLETVQFLTGLVVVLAGAKLIQWVSVSFHFTPRFTACFTVTAYGLSPIFLAHLLNCIPSMNPWISWAVGTFGCVFILYQGVGLVLEPEQTGGFGLYLLIALAFTLLSAMDHIVSLMVLQGKIHG